MVAPHDSGTQVTLLERLARSGAQEQAAWEQFVEHYGRKIYLWCRHWGLQEADSQDVTQTVLLKLARCMKGFAYDPSQSFRAWLKTVTQRTWLDYVDSCRRAVPGSGADGKLDQLQDVKAREDLVKVLEDQFDQELLEQAMQLVRLRVAPHNWKAFCLTAIEGVSAADAAKQLDMKIARVYAARSSIEQKLREECRRLESGNVTT